MRLVKCIESKQFCKKGDIVLYLGEISNMERHGVYCTKEGKIHWGYHTDSFINPTEDEI